MDTESKINENNDSYSKSKFAKNLSLRSHYGSIRRNPSGYSGATLGQVPWALVNPWNLDIKPDS